VHLQLSELAVARVHFTFEFGAVRPLSLILEPKLQIRHQFGLTLGGLVADFR
jgi:hypothetical protein